MKENSELASSVSTGVKLNGNSAFAVSAYGRAGCAVGASGQDSHSLEAFSFVKLAVLNLRWMQVKMMSVQVYA